MTKTLDGHDCYNPLHEAGDRAKKKLELLMKRIGAELGHYFDPDTCSSEANQLYD